MFGGTVMPLPRAQTDLKEKVPGTTFNRCPLACLWDTPEVLFRMARLGSSDK